MYVLIVKNMYFITDWGSVVEYLVTGLILGDRYIYVYYYYYLYLRFIIILYAKSAKILIVCT